MIITVDGKLENDDNEESNSIAQRLEASGWNVTCKYEDDEDMREYKSCSKDFSGDNPVGTAMWEFEKLLGAGADLTVEHMHDNLAFWWDDPSNGRRCSAMSWECGQYMFDFWDRRPRMVLEEYNALMSRLGVVRDRSNNNV